MLEINLALAWSCVIKCIMLGFISVNIYLFTVFRFFGSQYMILFSK